MVWLCLQERGAGEDEQQWALSRFTPLLQDVLEDMAANRLSTDEFPYVRPPSADPCKSGLQLMQAHRGTHLQLVAIPCGVLGAAGPASAGKSAPARPPKSLHACSAAAAHISWYGDGFLVYCAPTHCKADVVCKSITVAVVVLPRAHGAMRPVEHRVHCLPSSAWLPYKPLTQATPRRPFQANRVCTGAIAWHLLPLQKLPEAASVGINAVGPPRRDCSQAMQPEIHAGWAPAG